MSWIWNTFLVQHLPYLADIPFLSCFGHLLPPSQRVPITSGDLTDHQIGTDDVRAGVSNSINLVFGDAGRNMLEHAVGGNDTFSAGAESKNIFYGDAVGTLFNHAAGGNDTFSSTASFDLNTFYGDAGKNMTDHARG